MVPLVENWKINFDQKPQNLGCENQKFNSMTFFLVLSPSTLVHMKTACVTFTLLIYQTSLLVRQKKLNRLLRNCWIQVKTWTTLERLTLQKQMNKFKMTVKIIFLKYEHFYFDESLLSNLRYGNRNLCSWWESIISKNK